MFLCWVKKRLRHSFRQVIQQSVNNFGCTLQQQHTWTVYIVGNGHQIQKSKAYSRKSCFKYRAFVQVLRRVTFQYCYYLHKFCKVIYSLSNPFKMAGVVCHSLTFSKLLWLIDQKAMSKTLQLLQLMPINKQKQPNHLECFFLYLLYKYQQLKCTEISLTSKVLPNSSQG